MGAKLGLDGKLYLNQGTYEAPDWFEMTNVRDLTLNLEKGEADVTTRGNNGWRAIKATLKESSIEFEMVWDTADASFSAIFGAWMNNEDLELAVMDGDIEEPGAQGLRATFTVITCSRSEPLEEAMTASVTIKPGYAPEHPPEWLGADEGSSA